MHLLFVCTGNTCRSPLAEGIARVLIAQRGITDLTTGSAGVSAWDGMPASDGAMLVAMEHGIDLAVHRARLLTSALVQESDLILAMGPAHVDRVSELGGGARARLLTDFATGGRTTDPVTDPYGGDLTVYRHTYDELTTLIDALLDRIVSERGSAGP